MSYFDTIIYDNKFYNSFEDYFNLDNVSKVLGFKTYRIEQGALVNYEARHSSNGEKALRVATNVFKVLSYFTAVIPLAMFIGKICLRENLPYLLQDQQKRIDQKSSTLLNPSERANNRRADNKHLIGVDPMEAIKEPAVLLPDYDNCLTHLDWELSHKNVSKMVDHGCCGIEQPGCRIQLGSHLKNDPEIFYPKLTYKTNDLLPLITDISQAFGEGKKIAALTISSPIHTECAAFDDEGNFVILAGLSGFHTVDSLKTFTHALNQAQIKDASGNVIKFNGKYIDTGLQLGGHHCVRFAEIYRYQIAKEKNLHAYKKINGAFYSQQLKSFEDLANIIDVPEIEVMPKSTPKNNWEKTQYQFLLSMACRTYGVKRNKWEEITIKDLLTTLTWKNLNDEEISWCCYDFAYRNKQAPLPWGIYHYSLEKLQEEDKQYVEETASFGKLFHDKSLSLIIYKEGKHFLVKRDKLIT